MVADNDDISLLTIDNSINLTNYRYDEIKSRQVDAGTSLSDTHKRGIFLFFLLPPSLPSIPILLLGRDNEITINLPFQ